MTVLQPCCIIILFLKLLKAMIKTVAGTMRRSDSGMVQAGTGHNAGENHFGASILKKAVGTDGVTHVTGVESGAQRH